MARAPLGEGEYYHVYNRGVEKRVIFTTRKDYERFLFTLFACNDRRSHLNFRHQYRGLTSVREVEKVLAQQGGRDLLVDILCFCLMPNHFHLLLKQRGDDGISIFMQKVGTAYTMYFNTKYSRTGGLFAGTYKAVHAARDRYFLHLSRYIHLNPADFVDPDWRERGLRNAEKVEQFLVRYPWSSYADYVDGERYAFLLNTQLLQGLFRNPGEYADFVKGWRRGAMRQLPAGVVAVAGVKTEVQNRG